MAWVRKLPSGKWAATVRTPSGRITRTFGLKGAADSWSRDQESSLHQGNWIDPREGKVTVGELWLRFAGSRHQEKASRARDQSHWRVHVEPRWGNVAVGGILRPDVTAWIVRMQSSKTGATTIEGALGVLRGLLEQAVDARLIAANPAARIKTPRRSAHVDRILTPAEDEQLLDSLDRHFPGMPTARLMVELMLDTGMRWEEIAALDKEHVDTVRRVVKIGPVMERDGTVRPYPKSPSSVRDVPVGESWEALRKYWFTLAPGGLLFTAPEGGPLRYTKWRRNVWQVALHGRPAYRGAQGHPARPAELGAGLAGPQPTPHDCRHTYGTRLADNNVPSHEIKALMGHATLAATERYLHPGPARFDNARRALKRAKATATRGADSDAYEVADSPVTHDS